VLTDLGVVIFKTVPHEGYTFNLIPYFNKTMMGED
jgi:hypothetical protein